MTHPLPTRVPCARPRPTLLRTRLLTAAAALAAASAVAIPSEMTLVRSASDAATSVSESAWGASETRLPDLPDPAARAAEAAAAAVGSGSSSASGSSSLPGSTGGSGSSSVTGATGEATGAGGLGSAADPAARPNRHTRTLAAPRPSPAGPRPSAAPAQGAGRGDRVSGDRPVISPAGGADRDAPGSASDDDRGAEASTSDDAVRQAGAAPSDATYESDGTAQAEGRTALFAQVGAIDLRVPSRDELLLGFHQAAFRSALRMAPVADDVTPLRTLPSRGRPTPARSAVDVSVAPGTEVLSPVTGTVRKVDDYALYGKYPDSRVEIRPKADPEKKVTVLHVTEPTVSRGDEVVGGETTIAEEATQLPFTSQIDRHAGENPHVHVEVAND